MQAIAVIAVGYLIGCVNFAYLVMRVFGHADLRRLGTGNLGTRNIKRQLGLGFAILVLVLDLVKGALPVWLLQRAGAPVPMDLLVGLGVILGHNYPFWLSWHGGKGLAAGAGFLIAISWRLFLQVAAAGGVTLILTRSLYLAAVAMALVFPAVMWWFRPGVLDLIPALLISIVVLARHWGNMVDLFALRRK